MIGSRLKIKISVYFVTSVLHFKYCFIKSVVLNKQMYTDSFDLQKNKELGSLFMF